MPRGERLPRFGLKAEEMRRKARAIRLRNEERAKQEQRRDDAP